MATCAAGPGSKPHSGGAEARQLIRRLDWRFLLPDPRLRRVLYLGSDEGMLPRALRLFSDSLTVFPDGIGPELADLVVAQAARRSDVDAATKLLAPGGCLYWELAQRRAFLSDPVAWLRRRGFAEIRTHWHHPAFEPCRQIVPLDDPSASASFLRERFEWIDAAVLLAFSRWLIRPTHIWRLVTSVSIVARKPLSIEP